jgi:hypothetical protein
MKRLNHRVSPNNLTGIILGLGVLALLTLKTYTNYYDKMQQQAEYNASSVISQYNQ